MSLGAPEHFQEERPNGLCPPQSQLLLSAVMVTHRKNSHKFQVSANSSSRWDEVEPAPASVAANSRIPDQQQIRAECEAPRNGRAIAHRQERGLPTLQPEPNFAQIRSPTARQPEGLARDKIIYCDITDSIRKCRL